MEKGEREIWENIEEGWDSLETLYCNVEELTDHSDCMRYCVQDLGEDIEILELEIGRGEKCKQ